nr:IS110 family transposase [Paeniglutamicibacter psychrophenolicus]
MRTARTSAMMACTVLLNQISGALTSAAEEVRAKYRGTTSEARANAMVYSRPFGDPSDPVVATLRTLKRLGTRDRFLSGEITETDAELAIIVSTHAPKFLDVNSVGTAVAYQQLVPFGDNPERMESEATFAALASVVPVPASSGKTNRHRLSRGGDRQANSALCGIVLTRMSADSRTREYVANRTEDGPGKKGNLPLPQTLCRP